MKYVFAISLLLCSLSSFAQEKIKLNFKDEEITNIIEKYSKATGQKFIIDPGVRGKITILNPGEVTSDDAFNQISEALALNGFAIVTNGDLMTIKSARNAQRDNIQVYQTLPPAKPQKMVTWIINLKYVSSEVVLTQLRLLTSKDGEMSTFSSNNQLIISDWTSNLQRISDIIKSIDIPMKKTSPAR